VLVAYTDEKQLSLLKSKQAIITGFRKSDEQARQIAIERSIIADTFKYEMLSYF